MQRSILFNLASHLREVAALFQHISFAHIFRQFNELIYSLSKESLSVVLSQLQEDEYRNGTVVSSKICSLYDL